MRVTIHDAIKAVQIWCTKEERAQSDCAGLVAALLEEKRIDKSYRTVVYVSGGRDLREATGDLLRCNRDVSAP